MNLPRLMLKILMWVLIIGFLTDHILRTLSYSFYKGNRQFEKVDVSPQKISYGNLLTGYGYRLTQGSDSLILCFGGSFYTAYNSVGLFAGPYEVPFFAVDYYGTQDSGGKMNLASMQASAEGLYDWAIEAYPGRKIIVVGHSYGCGMAAYLASVRPCDHLYLLAGFSDLSDLYNRIVPIFHGPLKVFISDNMPVAEYAKGTDCPVTVVGSGGDRTLGSHLQAKVARSYERADLRIFPDIEHEKYLLDERVIALIQEGIE